MLDKQFFEITLPIVVSFVVTIWATQHAQNKRFDDFRESFKQFREELKEFRKEINEKFDKLDERIRNIELTKWR